MTATDFLTRLGLAHPIIQAPMGGGFTPPALVAAVSNAGALGSLGAPYLTPAQIADDVKRIRALTQKPFNVNLFAGGYASHNSIDPAPMIALLGRVHRLLGLPPPTMPSLTADPLPAQLDAILAAKPAVFSFAFGIPKVPDLKRLQAAGIYVIGTATTVEEAKQLDAAGVDAIAAQGTEAGGHRSTFVGPFEKAMVPVMDLVKQIVQAVPLPVIAAGGLMDGGDIADALARGAVAAQLGTAFLCCPEAGTPSAHKQALLEADSDTTAITRAFSGRPARGLMNGFMEMLQGKDEIILPFPVQNNLTRAMRSAATKDGLRRYMSLWAGTGAARCRSMPAADLVRALAAELAEAT
ncbi:MAG: nitronate monooxygenase [Rhodospirillaceae bacterium]|nr:MAG: nitronate monooxygenase [Rhodospirillaceae bacterium]